MRWFDLRAWWRREHDRFLEREKAALGFDGPAPVLRHYNSFTSYFRVRTAWDFAAARPGDRVLLVGDAGGKDYWFFRFMGVEPRVVDLAEQQVIPEVMIHDISSEELPFPDGSFDVIVMCDVLEHVYDDTRALANVRRMLKAGGRLVLSGPYWHDLGEYHVRIHSPLIIERMLRHHGFAVREMTSRGFVVNFYRVVHPLFLAGHIFWHRVTGRIGAPAFNYRLYLAIGRVQSRRWVPRVDRLLFGIKGGLNGYVLWAEKSDAPGVDLAGLTREVFSNWS